MMPALPGPGVSFSAAQLPMMTTLSASDGCHLYFSRAHCCGPRFTLRATSAGRFMADQN